MPRFMISYDDGQADHDYTEFHACLSKWNAAHLHKSIWLVELVGPCEEIRRILRMLIHPNDAVCVLRIPDFGGDWATANADPAGVDWLRSRYT